MIPHFTRETDGRFSILPILPHGFLPLPLVFRLDIGSLAIRCLEIIVRIPAQRHELSELPRVERGGQRGSKGDRRHLWRVFHSHPVGRAQGKVVQSFISLVCFSFTRRAVLEGRSSLDLYFIGRGGGT